jgi:hypothetical protein
MHRALQQHVHVVNPDHFATLADGSSGSQRRCASAAADVENTGAGRQIKALDGAPSDQIPQLQLRASVGCRNRGSAPNTRRRRFVV